MFTTYPLWTEMTQAHEISPYQGKDQLIPKFHTMVADSW